MRVSNRKPVTLGFDDRATLGYSQWITSLLIKGETRMVRPALNHNPDHSQTEK